MSRSYRKQPVWKDHNRNSKKYANRRLRRVLNRNHDLSFPHGAYKRYNESWEICDYCSLIPRSFEQYYQWELLLWRDRRNTWYFRNEPFPNKKEIYREWLRYRNK